MSVSTHPRPVLPFQPSLFRIVETPYLRPFGARAPVDDADRLAALDEHADDAAAATWTSEIEDGACTYWFVTDEQRDEFIARIAGALWMVKVAR